MVTLPLGCTLVWIVGSLVPAVITMDAIPPPQGCSLPPTMSEWGEQLVVPEWESDHDIGASTTSPHEEPLSYRSQNGWKGTDFMHSQNSPVRITDYHCRYGAGTDIKCPMPTTSTDASNGSSDAQTSTAPSPVRGGAGTVLTGRVHFTAAAESHAGYCHGGTMCSVMDDAVGWVAFCVTGTVQPWTGFTVQINTSLIKPILCHSTLLVQATIDRVERRKVMVSAKLYDPLDDTVHATCEGVVVLNKGVLVVDDTSR